MSHGGKKTRAVSARTKGSYYRALYHRHKARGGPKRAIVAVQHAMMVAIWHMFSRGKMHEDLGPDHFQGHGKKRRLRYPVGQLRRLGVDVPLEGAA